MFAEPEFLFYATVSGAAADQRRWTEHWIFHVHSEQQRDKDLLLKRHRESVQFHG